MTDETIPQHQESVEAETVKAVDTEIVETPVQQEESSQLHEPTNEETAATSVEEPSNTENQSSDIVPSKGEDEDDANKGKESDLTPKEVKPTPEEITAAAFQAVYEKALETKEQGTAFYKAQQFTSAKVKYAEAMASIQNQSGDFTNEQRAIIFEMSLTCSSNMALCSWSLNEYQECIIHGRNTLLLIGALESKLSESLIWEELQKKGMTAQKLSGLKLKAYRIIGKAEYEKSDFEAAKSDLEDALKICEDQKLIKELNDLIQRCTKKIAQQSKKEKSLWKKAFETNNLVPDEEPISLPTTPTRPNPSSFSKSSSTPKGNFEDDNKGTVSKNYDFSWPMLVIASVTAVGAAAAFWWMRNKRR